MIIYEVFRGTAGLQLATFFLRKRFSNTHIAYLRKGQRRDLNIPLDFGLYLEYWCDIMQVCLRLRIWIVIVANHD